MHRSSSSSKTFTGSLLLVIMVLVMVIVMLMFSIVALSPEQPLDCPPLPEVVKDEVIVKPVKTPVPNTTLSFNDEEKRVIEQIYDIIKNPKKIKNVKGLKNLRVPSGSNMIYKVYKWITDLQKKHEKENPDSNYLSHELKVAIADLLWFFQERDIKDSKLGSCKEYSLGDDWKTNTWAGYYQHFVPVVGCDTVYRAGLMGDGGKHLCNVHRIMKDNVEKKEQCMVFSLGTYTDISFDNQMYHLLGCRSHAFDPTISKSQLQSQLKNKFITFHQYGIGPGMKNAKKLAGKPLKTLTEISKELGIEKVDILKIDIEGNEIPVFDHIFNKENGILKKLKVKIILVEYHHPSAIFKKTKKFDCHDRKKHLYPFLKNFYDNGYYMYRFEHNVYGVSCIEYGFISKDMI